MMNVNKIESLDWQPKLGEIGKIVEDFDDINQCIYIILATPKGSDPHRPEFGSDLWKYIDYPVDQAIPNVIREAIDAITTWEPRVEIVKITAEIIEAQVKFTIEWKLKTTQTEETIEVTV